MHVLLSLLLLDTVPGDIDIGDKDSDTASQEASPTSSVASPREHATSFLPGSERRHVEKGNRRTCYSVLHIILLINFMYCFVYFECCTCELCLCTCEYVCVSDCAARPHDDWLMDAALCLTNIAVSFLYVCETSRICG